VVEMNAAAAGDGGVEGHAGDRDEEALVGDCCGGHKVAGQFAKNSCRQPPGRLMHMGGGLDSPC